MWYNFTRYYFFGVSCLFRFKDKLLAIPFPDTCIVCGNPVETTEYACSRCKNKIPYISTAFKCKTCLGFLHSEENGVCGSCLIEKPQYSRLISCVNYESYVQKTIKAFKFWNRPDYHLGYSKLACEILERDGLCFDAVIPIPLSKKSLKKRGYNQSALISKRIAMYFDVPYYDDVLLKIKETKRQSELKLEYRKKNIKGAFGVFNPERLSGLNILLVDDIFTSGNTMREASKILSPYTKSITAFTVARAKFKY